jgi:hypothetical protein
MRCYFLPPSRRLSPRLKGGRSLFYPLYGPRKQSLSLTLNSSPPESGTGQVPWSIGHGRGGSISSRNRSGTTAASTPTTPFGGCSAHTPPGESVRQPDLRNPAVAGQVQCCAWMGDEKGHDATPTQAGGCPYPRKTCKSLRHPPAPSFAPYGTSGISHPAASSMQPGLVSSHPFIARILRGSGCARMLRRCTGGRCTVCMSLRRWPIGSAF